MSDILTERGVAEDRMLLEDKTETTEENYANMARMVDPGAPIVLISINYHMDRSVQNAKDAGFSDVLRMPTPSTMIEHGASVMWEVIMEMNNLLSSIG
jgi:uncharacterized SAM-binding protein YcdF (DUF218 family)